MDIPYLLLIIVVSCFVAAFSKKTRIQGELGLLISAGVLSFLVPAFDMDPGHLIEIVLPPLLFVSARHVGANKFRLLKRPIFSLGIGLILFTFVSVALTTYYLLPERFQSWPAALMLGAVVAPIDAVSAIAIGSKMKMNTKTLTILTGESLINDATSLTLFSLALEMYLPNHRQTANPVLAIIYSYLVDHPFELFLYTLFLGALIGFLAGWISRYIRRFLKESSLITIYTIILPWAVYFVSEKLLCSGVIGVVVCGFVIEKMSFKASFETRIQEDNLWKTFEKLLELFAFAYMGLQAKTIVTEIELHPLSTTAAILLSIAIFIVVVITRPIWIFTTEWIWNKVEKNRYLKLREVSKVLYSRFTDIEQRREKRRQIITEHDKLKIYKSLLLDTNEKLILSWSGMRGVVTLCIAATVPRNMVSDFGEPLYALIVFLAMSTVVLTLLIQGFTLPKVIKRFSKKDVIASKWREHHMQVAKNILTNSIQEVIDEIDEEDEQDIDKEKLRLAIDRFIHSQGLKDSDELSGILNLIVQTQRENIIEASNNGELDPDIAKQTLNRLDHRQALL